MYIIVIGYKSPFLSPLILSQVWVSYIQPFVKSNRNSHLPSRTRIADGEAKRWDAGDHEGKALVFDWLILSIRENPLEINGKNHYKFQMQLIFKWLRKYEKFHCQTWRLYFYGGNHRSLKGLISSHKTPPLSRACLDPRLPGPTAHTQPLK